MRVIIRWLHRSTRRLVLVLLKATRWVRPARSAPDPQGPAPIRILLVNAYAMGGTIRTVLNLAGHLARDHDVEIVSLIRRRKRPFFPIPDGVTVTVLDDRTEPPGRLRALLARIPSVLTPVEDGSFRSLSLWTDLRLARGIWDVRAGVLITTRPSLNLLAAELAPSGVVTIGQDHMNLGSYRAEIRRAIRRRYGRLTVLSVLTRAALADYEEVLAGAAVRVVRIPNALPDVGGGMSAGDGKVIIAAGRLSRQKGFDLLIKAFEEVALAHPGWILRIFGSGQSRDELAAMIAARGLDGRVILKARTPTFGQELAGASVYVLSSRFEGMPMVIIEAMSKGLAVVAFDCPQGPAELITHREDGLLVPAEDVAALTAALTEVIEDEALRLRLGERARRSAQAYDLAVVGAQWDALLAELRP
ncbi:MAG: glycosyl transferase group 1 [Streptosporangiaceae bacterium]|nr:glycosyl transferase group 1 [Streptosporangiaceae bacterium]